MTTDWENLAPNRPLGRDDPAYVSRPWGGGDRLAVRIRSGLAPIAVVGTFGSGRSTELHRAHAALAPDVVAISLAVERFCDPSDLSPTSLWFGLARELVEHAAGPDHEIQPSHGIIQDIRASDPQLPRGTGKKRAPLELARMALREIESALGRGRVALLIDGLERAAPDQARSAVRSLLELRDAAHLVMVVAPTLANGPESHDLLSQVRVFSLPTIPVREEPGVPWEEGRRFLVAIALRRLQVATAPAGLEPQLWRAAVMSGGVPKTFLQLLADAGGYASAEGRDLPSAEDLSGAIRDHTDGLRRVLVEGDLDALAEADGTTGLEVPADRRVRFLSHRLLLEVERGEGLVVHPHPLLQGLVDARRPRGGRPRKRRTP
jgi:hypothetical protein